VGADEGVGSVGFLVLVVIAVAVVVLVVRAAAAQDGPRPPRASRRTPPRPVPRPVAPDDDPEFLAQLDRWTRRDDGLPG